MTKKVSLKQLALKLGVSTATISNAFNRPNQLSAELREHILAESKRLGYTGPNHAARSLRRGKSDIIAVVLADSLSYSFSDPVASRLLEGISDELAVHEKQLLLMSSKNVGIGQTMAESLPDGFIFYGAPEGTCFERILALGKPSIAIDFEQDKVPAVNIDNYQAAKEIALHVLSDETKDVAILGIHLADSNRICRLLPNDIESPSTQISHRRLAGYMDAAKQKNISIPLQRVWHIPVNRHEDAEIAAEEALSTNPRPQILLCMSDVIALSAIKVATKRGLRVPQDIKIAGFDDVPEAARSTPPLTTVCQQVREKGKLAVQLLFNEGSTTEYILDTRLVIRAST